MKPTKPTDNRLRVLRGGGWLSVDAAGARAARRDRRTPAIRNYGPGFRCVQRGCQQILKDGAL